MRWAERDPELAALADQWAGEVQAGDVVRTHTGDLRVVRAVHRHCIDRSGKGGWSKTQARRTYCYFAIKRCSWTHRPYTQYSIGEMVTMGWTPTDAKPSRLNAAIDHQLLADFEADAREDLNLTCCAVRGLP